MMKVYNDNIKPEFVGFGDVKIGDTFAVNHSSGVCSVYIKIANESDNEYSTCICLNDGRIEALASPRITGFYANIPVRLIDCELHWKFRDARNKEDKGEE